MHIESHILNKLSALSMAAIIGLALFSSCSSDNEEPSAGEPREISFRASNIQGSRADTGSEPLNPDYKMWVTSIYHNEQNTNHYYHLADMLFESKTVDSQTIWAAPGGAYYPLNGKMDFLAYASMNGAHKPIANFNTSENLPIVSNVEPYFKKIELDYRSSGLDGTDDVLVSAVSPGAPCGKDAMNSVPLEFDHLLSNVQFKFPAFTEDAQIYMRVGVEMSNVRLSGKAQLEREKGSAWTITWPAEYLTEPATIRKETEIQPIYNTPDATPFVDFYLPPQTLNDDVQFTIYYKYSSESNITEEMPYLDKIVFSQIGTSAFEAGKRYIYNVRCKILPTIEFNISLEDGNGFVIDTWTIEPPINLDPQ